VGYGRTYYNNQTVNIAVFSKDNNLYLYNPAEKQIIYLVRWFGKPYVRMKAYEDPAEFEKFTDKDQTELLYVSYDGFGNTLPITFSSHVDIFKKFRLELGSSLYINQIKTLKPDEKHTDLPNYEDPKGMHYTIKFYVMPSFKLLENAAYTALINAQAGVSFSYGDLIKDKQAIHNSIIPITIGLGFTLEKHISEYFSVFGRLLYENSVGNDRFNSKNTILLDQKSLFLQIGITINCPELPRCPFPNCEVEVKHKHLDKPYRGVSMFTGKNSLGYRLYNK
jgi:hypothetical protein